MNGSNDTVWVLIISVFSACLAFLFSSDSSEYFSEKAAFGREKALHLQILSKENTASESRVG